MISYHLFPSLALKMLIFARAYSLVFYSQFCMFSSLNVLILFIFYVCISNLIWFINFALSYFTEPDLHLKSHLLFAKHSVVV